MSTLEFFRAHFDESDMSTSQRFLTLECLSAFRRETGRFPADRDEFLAHSPQMGVIVRLD